MKQIKRDANMGRGELLMTRGLNLIGMAVLAGLIVACSHDDDDAYKVATPANRPNTESPSKIAEFTAQSDISALLAATSNAGPVDELSRASDNYSEIATTDAALTSLATTLGFSSAAAMVEALPPSALESVLMYHVLSKVKAAADLVSGSATQAAVYDFVYAQSTLTLTTTSGVAKTDDALMQDKVPVADVPASNGIVHAIDKVLAEDVPLGARVYTLSSQSISFSKYPIGMNDTTDTNAPIVAIDVRETNGASM